MNHATLLLFNAVQIDEKKSTNNLLLDKTVKDGYVLSPEVAAIATPSMLADISKMIGISGEKVNSSFHKSWQKIREARIEQLYLEQIIHYFTTYGLEAFGAYSSETVFIPNEKLEIPQSQVVGGLKLTVIRGLNSQEIFDKIVTLVSGIALSSEVINAIMRIEETNQYGLRLLDKTKNRELRAKLYAYHNLVPTDPEEFLRYVVSVLTDETLLVKNPNLIEKIKESTKGHWLDKVIGNAPKNLPSIFYRYKPLFLAMKHLSKDKHFFNKLRKDAVKQHIPLQPLYLSTITSRIKHGIGLEELESHLKLEPIFRKVRLAQALKYRSNPGKTIVYRIRNGKGYVDDFEFKSPEKAQEALEVVFRSICSGLNVHGKTIYMPSYVELAIPATEKQFIGNIPMGSFVRTSQDLIAGIHWNNVNGHRIDLDLSAMSIGGNKVGWDAKYRTDNILFSGDMTDASGKNGASELFYFHNNKKFASQLLTVNYFNHSDVIPVPFSIVLAYSASKPSNFERNYMVDPNTILTNSKTVISEKQQVIGLVSHSVGENRFYFVNTTMGNSRSVEGSKYIGKAHKYLVNSLDSVISLREVLTSAGAHIVTERPEVGIEYVDLSPESLDKATLIQLLTN